MRLLIDQGNTRVKWALAEDRVEAVADLTRDVNQDLQVLPALDGSARAEVVAEAVGEALADLGPWSAVLAVSVASAARREALADAVGTATGLRPRFLSSPSAGDGLVNAYPEPARLGADRWYAMVGARARVGGAFCLLCAGTAITLDAVDAGGRHRGGLILPGLSLAREALARGTGGLPAVDAEGPMPDAEELTQTATDTETAIRAGQVLAAAAAAERQAALLDKLGQEATGEAATIVVTGGDAGAVAAWIRRDRLVLPDLVLQGLAITGDADTDGRA